MSFMQPTPPIVPGKPQLPATRPALTKPAVPGFPPPPQMDPMQMGRPDMPPVLSAAGTAPPILPTGLPPVGPMDTAPRPMPGAPPMPMPSSTMKPMPSTPAPGGGPIVAPPLSTPPGYGAPQHPFVHPPAPEINYAARKARKRAAAGAGGEPPAPAFAAPAAPGVVGGPADRPRKFMGGGPQDQAAMQRKAMKLKL